MKTPSKSLEPSLAKARASLIYETEGAKLEFTEQIVALMDDEGVTKSVLAERLNVAPAYVTKVLQGTTNFTLESMVKLARSLGADLHLELKPAKSAAIQLGDRNGRTLNSKRQGATQPAIK